MQNMFLFSDKHSFLNFHSLSFTDKRRKKKEIRVMYIQYYGLNMKSPLQAYEGFLPNWWFCFGWWWIAEELGTTWKN
jgi:hypothetical protein